MLFKLLFLFGDSSLHQFDRMVHQRSRTDLSGSFEGSQLVCWWLVVLVLKFCHWGATAAFSTSSALLASVSITLSIAHLRYLLAGTRQSSALLAWGFCSAHNWTTALMKGGGPCFYLFFDERVKKQQLWARSRQSVWSSILARPLAAAAATRLLPPSLRGVSATRRRVVPPRVTSKYELKEQHSGSGRRDPCMCAAAGYYTLNTATSPYHAPLFNWRTSWVFLSPPEARSCREVSVASSAVFLPFPRRNVS